MKRTLSTLVRILIITLFAATTGTAVAHSGGVDADYCMEIDLGPFHMIPGYAAEDGACGVRDYWDGELQERYYPFTVDEHRFNCEVFGDATPLPTGDLVPSSVASETEISGTIGGHPFSGTLLCASLTNWYESSCTDPLDPDSPCFQLQQPFFKPFPDDPYSRVTEVSIFDGTLAVEGRGGRVSEVPLLIATRAAGITHIESLDPPQVGASVTHNLLGMVTYRSRFGKTRVKELDGSLDALLQGHIFFPQPVTDDPNAARVKGVVCSKDLYRELNPQRRYRHKLGHSHD